uniref:Uncharacterized protein n=1 Tax=Leersia perrieri TaxID=77586 RepID=A0A0D9XR74_9ORYZ
MAKACGAREETTYYALIECTMAKTFWEAMKVITRIKLPHLCPAMWTVDILDDAICKEWDRCVI